MSDRRSAARRDPDGYFWYAGRADDVFKTADYRISPFELESEMLGRPAVAETAVVASADPIRLAVPKVFVALKPGQALSRELACDLFDEGPGQLPRVDAHEGAPDQEGRVLGANLAVDRAPERPLEQLRLAEAGERVEVTLLLLGRPGRLDRF